MKILIFTQIKLFPNPANDLISIYTDGNLFAENSGHNVQVDEPDAAIAAIVKMVELVRQSTQQ